MARTDAFSPPGHGMPLKDIPANQRDRMGLSVANKSLPGVAATTVLAAPGAGYKYCVWGLTLGTISANPVGGALWGGVVTTGQQLPYALATAQGPYVNVLPMPFILSENAAVIFDTQVHPATTSKVSVLYTIIEA